MCGDLAHLFTMLRDKLIPLIHIHIIEGVYLDTHRKIYLGDPVQVTERRLTNRETDRFFSDEPQNCGSGKAYFNPPLQQCFCSPLLYVLRHALAFSSGYRFHEQSGA